MSVLLDAGRDLATLNNSKGGTVCKDGLIYSEIKLNPRNKDNTLYLLIKENELKVVDLDIEDDIAEFHDRLKLVLLTDANKVLMTGGKYPKKSMSLSPLTISFNIDTLRKNYGNNSWSEILTGINKEGFSALYQNIEEDSKVEYIKSIDKACSTYLESNIDEISNILHKSNDGMVIRMVFDLDISHFEKANKLFYYDMNKIFANIKEVTKHEDELYGYNSFICTNAKKPFLLSKIRSNKNEVYNISTLNNLRDLKIIEELGYITKSFKNEKRNNVYYWEYDTKEPEINIKKNNYIGDKRKAVGKATVWQLGKYIQGKDKELSEYHKKFFNNETITIDKYRLIERIVIDKALKDMRLDIESKEIAHNINILLSIKDYYKIESEDLMTMFKSLQDVNNIQIKNDKEFSYLLGQVVYYVNSFGIEAKDKNTFGYIYKYTTNTNNITDNLIRDMNKYQKNIGRTKLFSEVVSKLLTYKYKTLDKAMFVAGVLDNNIFYQKQVKKNENTNNEEEI